MSGTELLRTKRARGQRGSVLGVATVWLAIAGCVEAGSLENQEEFQALLSLDGGGLLDGGEPHGDAGSQDAPMSGGGAPGTGGTGTTGTGGATPMGTGGAVGTGGAAPDAGGMPAGPGCPEACGLFKMRCGTAGCHAAASPAAGLDLVSRNIGMRLADKPAASAACSGETLIDTAMPENSLLHGKLVDPPACGSRMPLGAPLSAMQIDCVRRWLADPACPGDTP